MEVSSLREDVTVLQEEVSVLKDDVSVLKDDVSVLKDDVSVLKDDVSDLKEEVSDLKDGTTAVHKDLHKVHLLIENDINRKVNILLENHTDLYDHDITLSKRTKTLETQIHMHHSRISFLEEITRNVQTVFQKALKN